MNSRLRITLAVFVVQFIALLAAWVLLPSAFRESRSNDYLIRSEPVARNYLNGDGFRENNGDLMTRYPPGHPLFLIAVFRVAEVTGISEPTVLGLFAITFQATSGALLFLLATELWSPLVALIISLLWLTYPPPFYLSIKGNNEIPFTPVFLLHVWIAFRGFQDAKGWQFVWSGIVLGLGMLIRPFVLLLPTFLGGLSLTPFLRVGLSRRIILGLLFIAGVGVAIFPWQVWTFRHTNKFYLVSSVGVHGVMDGMTYGVPRPNRITMDMPEGVLKLQQSAFQNWSDRTIVDFGSFLDWVRRDVSQQPLDMASIIFRKSLRTWYATDSHRWESKLLLMQLPYLAICLVGGVLCFRKGGDARRITILVAVIVLFYWAMTIAGLSIMRYIVPVMPLMLLLTAPIVESCLDRCGWLPHSSEALDTIED